MKKHIMLFITLLPGTILYQSPVHTAASNQTTQRDKALLENWLRVKLHSRYQQLEREQGPEKRKILESEIQKMEAELERFNA